MTAAAASGPESAGTGRPPFADASAAQLRVALIPEDDAEFDRQWRAVMATATETLDLTGVHQTLETWRRVAWLTTTHGPEGYRHLLAIAEQRARHRRTSPGAVPWQQLHPELTA